MKLASKKIHEVLSRLHHLPKLCFEKIQGCDLHEDEWGKAGSVVCRYYVHDGKASFSNEKIETIDDENNLSTFKAIEGDLLEFYKSFKTIDQVTPKEEGSLLTMALEYEKLNEVPDPYELLEYFVHIVKDIDDNLQKQA